VKGSTSERLGVRAEILLVLCKMESDALDMNAAARRERGTATLASLHAESLDRRKGVIELILLRPRLRYYPRSCGLGWRGMERDCNPLWLGPVVTFWASHTKIDVSTRYPFKKVTSWTLFSAREV